MLALDPQRQRTIERRKLMQTIGKAETQIAALQRFAALPPETMAAVKQEASDMGRRAYDALDGRAILVADTLQYAVDRTKRDANVADWQILRKLIADSSDSSSNSHCLPRAATWNSTSGVWRLSVSIKMS